MFVQCQIVLGQAAKYFIFVSITLYEPRVCRTKNATKGCGQAVICLWQTAYLSLVEQPSCAPSDAQTVAVAYRTNDNMYDVTGNSLFDMNIII